ncbi:hypothetical protein [Pseudoalteromonas tunicata]|uniref:Uncharacterized protein n=1 Tax=Pseudoalteromonas tunicata D2 TaxID=87626 RepID=A4CF80_9GAMM|nr:hypothetical protein [Pseudoalteromonas tunicata]ATC96214.1 hypothetical protein PTUN_a3967 [Pseudoalteromonas tunicata]AXT31730.1 hypothetical protein D1819_13465 [Pseudoalteromonas tunicata]EAR26628.1 hypothetical protein PTD2_00427 [Pseudoalteromonas tunicata D2]
MKTSLIAAAIAAVSLTSYFGFFYNNQSNELMLTDDVAQPISSDLNSAPSTVNTPIKNTQITNETITPERTTKTQTVDIQEIVKETLEIDLSQENEYYSFIITQFPQLKDDITTYRAAVKTQREQVEIFEANISERNKRIATSRFIPAGSDDELIYQRDLLLEQAKELGKQAMVLNQAIRDAAYN